MKFVVAGGGVAGLAAALAVARAGHEVVLLERDPVDPALPAEKAFEVPRRGIPHFFQPHAFLPRGRQVLTAVAPDVLASLIEAGAEPQDLRSNLHGPPEPGDEDLVYLWVRRPLIEWALRRAVAGEPDVDLRAGVEVTGLLASDDGLRALGVSVAGGEAIRGDVVVDALGRYRAPPGWPRAAGAPTDTGAVYYCRYFRLCDGVEHLDGGPLNPLNPRGDLGYMGFNTFRGDNRTYAVILLAPSTDRELRALRHEPAWMAACSGMKPLDVMTSSDYGRPITDVMPMGGLMNVSRTGGPGVGGVVALGDALCHTDPAFAWGLSLALAHAQALARAAGHGPEVDPVVARYYDEVVSEADERHRVACEIDEARSGRWSGEPIDPSTRDGNYPLFAFSTALAASRQDDLVLRRTIRRIGLLDRTHVFDEDADLHDRIETIFARLMETPPPAPGPSRNALIAAIASQTPS